MNTIEISVIIFPDGTTKFVKTDPIHIQKIITTWKETLPAERLKEFDEAKLHGGVANIKMLKHDWFWIKGKQNAH